MKKRKGMSPLIAAVILIAATMSIAAILAYWATTYVREELGSAEELGIAGGAKCLEAQFELRSGSYSGRTLTLILDNKKSVDLTLTDLFLIYSDNTVENHTLDTMLNGNEIKTVTVSDVTDNFLTGEIKTHCSDVSVYFTYDQVT